MKSQWCFSNWVSVCSVPGCSSLLGWCHEWPQVKGHHMTCVIAARSFYLELYSYWLINVLHKCHRQGFTKKQTMPWQKNALGIRGKEAGAQASAPPSVRACIFGCAYIRILYTSHLGFRVIKAISQRFNTKQPVYIFAGVISVHADSFGFICPGFEICASTPHTLVENEPSSEEIQQKCHISVLVTLNNPKTSLWTAFFLSELLSM